jgi:Fe-S-cluster containining protein
MVLSNADVERLEKAGYNRQRFMRYDRHGFAKLKNSHGVCFFYDPERGCCRIYRLRPSGCRTYPVVCSEEEGVMVDELCPMKNTVSKRELENKGKKVTRLLQIIDDEVARRNRT